MKKMFLSLLVVIITYGLSEAQIVNASQYFNHTSNSHLRGKVRLWKEGSSADSRVSHGLGTEVFHNTYGPGSTYANTIGHKFYVHGNEVVARFGVGGAGVPANRLTSYVNGKLGIGTTVPSHVLHVKTASAVGLFESTTNTAYLRLQNNEGFGKRVEFTNRAGGRASIWVSGAGDAFNVLANGRVGIGTTAPSHVLHVKTASAVGLFESTTNTAYLRLQNNEGFGKRVEFTNRTGGRASIWVSGAGDAFNVLANGNVGIGTTNPIAKLTVNGKVLAEEVEVVAAIGLNWPDYVFKSDYSLTSLPEVEKFINKNHHLPGVPSEKEVKENGINLGEMDAVLLKKIEELTLYVIELKKENESLKSLAEDIKILQTKLDLK